jgi:hypothetical protein
MVTTPMIVLSAIIIKERMRKNGYRNQALGLLGTASLILYGKSIGSAKR